MRTDVYLMLLPDNVFTMTSKYIVVVPSNSFVQDVTTTWLQPIPRAQSVTTIAILFVQLLLVLVLLHLNTEFTLSIVRMLSECVVTTKWSFLGVEDGEDRKTWRVAANILNSQLWATNKVSVHSYFFNNFA
jgi:hypothetical protein